MEEGLSASMDERNTRVRSVAGVRFVNTVRGKQNARSVEGGRYASMVGRGAVARNAGAPLSASTVDKGAYVTSVAGVRFVSMVE